MVALGGLVGCEGRGWFLWGGGVGGGGDDNDDGMGGSG